MRTTHDGVRAASGSPATSAGGGAQPVGGGGGDGGIRHAPSSHRAAASACTQPRGPVAVPGPPNCPGNSAAGCTQDSDCIEGANGRCVSDTHGCTQVYCSYDGCQSDSDCAPNEACACRESAWQSTVNSCVNAECHIDADCGLGGFCSPSLVGNPCMCLSAAACKPNEGSCSPGPCVCGDSCGHGYFCHTPQDTCLDDGDCEAGAGATCNYDALEHRWNCARATLCPL